MVRALLTHTRLSVALLPLNIIRGWRGTVHLPDLTEPRASPPPATTRHRTLTPPRILHGANPFVRIFVRYFDFLGKNVDVLADVTFTYRKIYV